MILNRLGNKTKIAQEIQKHFPVHDAYFEPFFGAGGMFFNKPKVSHNFLNDVNGDVYNLFRTLLDSKDELVWWIENTPIDEKLFKEWYSGKREKTNVHNAIRFLFLSNFALYGRGSTLRIGLVNPKRIILENINYTFRHIKYAYFFNCDFREIFKKIDYKTNIERCFVYCDPPYLNTVNNYGNSFTEQDSFELFETL
ncbi:DNA adenine methylase, partial [Flavobacterium sp.]|uniref:DNA adenine methylase n=1 Tax=Flavobacterium sp. TaxID=239 RepID=UPI002B4B61C8